MPLSLDAVLALSPDDSSTKAARGLLSPAKWPSLGANESAVWGECQGSGSRPYQTQVDLSSGAPAFKCSCPSRKFPCKHGLALLMLQAQDPTRFATTTAPAWVNEWHQSRAEKAQKKQEKAAPPPAIDAATDPEAAAAAAQQAAKAQAKAQTQTERRWQRMSTGATELQRWLADKLRQGLGSAGPNLAEEAEALAARLVDAQAAGLAGRLRELAQASERREAPQQLLQRLGLLQLLCDALAQRQHLPPEPLADLRSTLGWPQDRAELLASAPVVEDAWLVLGQCLEEREGNVRERRVWLHGQNTQRRALLLDHAHPMSGGFEHHWLNGSVVQTGLVFYPGAAALRALPTAAPVGQSVGLNAAEDAPWPQPDAEAEWLALAQRSAACPWLTLHPLLCSHAVLEFEAAITGTNAGANAGANTGATADALWLRLPSGRRLPLSLNEADVWSLLAMSAGRPVQLMGEWNGWFLRPLAARIAPASTQADALVNALADRHWQTTPLASAQAPSAVLNQPFWAALMPAAMVGTERSPLPQLAWPAELQSSLGQFLGQVAQASASDAALTLLRSAGVLGLCERAGQQGQHQPPRANLPAPAGPDRMPALADGPCLATLDRVLQDSSPRPLASLLRTLAERGWRLPARQLTQALDQGRRASVLRPSVLAVAGERGRWLGQINSAWVWASGAAPQEDPETLWTDGSLAQRLAVLQAQRAQDPAAARARLEAVLGELPARERAELLGALGQNLSPADEALLNKLCQDRSREVREVARSLLMCLPDSAFVQRSTARVAALLKQERGGLLSLKKIWTIDAPQTAAEDWKADDLASERPKGERLGERAWWLSRLVAQVPLAWWQQHTGLAGAQLLDWAKAGDWGDALLRGWYQALLVVPDVALLQALLSDWPKALNSFTPSSLLAVLPADAREAFWIGRLQAGQGLGEALARLTGLDASAPALLSILPTLLAATPPGEWVSAELSAALVKALPEAIGHLRKSQRWGWGHDGWPTRFVDMVALLHPSALAPMQALPPELFEDLSSIVTAVLDRQRLLALPTAPT